LENPDHEIYVSVASAWEIVVKSARGKLRLPTDPGTYLRSRLKRSKIRALDVTLDHVTTIANLPEIHRDPFDRILVAQAQTEGLTLVTADRDVARYDISVQDARK